MFHIVYTCQVQYISRLHVRELLHGSIPTTIQGNLYICILFYHLFLPHLLSL